MAPQTLATADALLKELYLGPVVETVNYKTFLLDKVERDSDSVDFTGRRAIVPVQSAPNPARGSIGDGGTLVTPGKDSYVDAIVPIRYHDAGFEITDQTIKQGKGAGALANVLERGTQNVAKVMRKNINRQIFGSGTGVLATITANVAAAAVATVDTTQYVRVGDPVDILDKDDFSVIKAGAVVTAVDRTALTITIDSTYSATAANNVGFFLAGSAQLEIDGGLQNATNTSRTMFGINSATAGNEFWNGNKINAATAPSFAVATESLFEQLADNIGQQGNGDVAVFLTSRGVRRRLADTYTSQKRFNDARAVEYHGGYTAIFVNEIPVISDDDAPKHFVFALPDWNDGSMKIFEVAGPDWLKSQDGNVWQLATTGTNQRKASWQAWFVWYMTFGLLAPNRSGQLAQCTDDNA